MDIQKGTIIRDWEVVDLIGEGGMSEVYLVQDNLDRQFAMKVLSANLSRDPSFKERFKQEAKIMANLHHPHIVQLHSFFDQDDLYCLVMEYVEGGSLKDLIKQKGPIPEERALRIFHQIAEALAYAHDKGVIHRDIKPSNILIGKDDTVKVMDFGIARMTEGPGLTRTGTQMGTLVYMSPEQIRDSKHVDSKTDVYSLGVTLYEMLTGKAPYDETTDSDYDIRVSIVNKDLPDPTTIYPHISNSSVKLLNALTQKDSKPRPAIGNLNQEEITVIEPSKAIPKPQKTEPSVIKPQVIKQKKESPSSWVWGVTITAIVICAVIFGIPTLIKPKSKSRIDNPVTVIPQPKLINQKADTLQPIDQQQNSIQQIVDKDVELWQIAVRNGTIEDYRHYLTEFPTGKYVNKARNECDNLLWKEVLVRNDVQAYEDYVSEFPRGEHAMEAKDNYDYALWNNAKAKNTVDAYRTYLINNPNGKYIKDARAYIQILDYHSEWLSDYNQALLIAKYYKKPILFHFSASSWCSWCTKLSKEVIDTKIFENYVKDRYVLLRYDSPKSGNPSQQDFNQLSKKYDITGYPTILILNQNGDLVKSIVGYQSGGPEVFIQKILDYHGEWLSDYNQALLTAKYYKKPILFHFSASSWCSWCTKLSKEVIDTKIFENYVKDRYVLLRYDSPKSGNPSQQDFNQLSKKYDITGYPTILILNQNGDLVKSIVGYQSGGPEVFIQKQLR